MKNKINKLAKKLHNIIENEVERQTEKADHYFRQNSIINVELDTYIARIRRTKKNCEREGLTINALKKETQLEALLEFQNIIKDCFTGVFDE